MTYEWNAESQLKRVLKNSVEQARFAYDPLGRRVERIAGGVTTGWTYDSEDILREVRGASTLKYVHSLRVDEPLATDDGSALSYFHADGLGSMVKTTGATGVVTLTRRYDAWGNLDLGGSTSGHAFTGREHEPETGLVYYRARYFDPKIGRFLSEDPIKFAAGLNFYAYVENNPTNYTDPMGLSKASCVAACTAAGAGAGAAAGAAGGLMAGATAGGMAGAAAGAAGGMGVGAIPGGAGGAAAGGSGGAAAGAAMGAAIGGTAGFITGMIMCESSGPVKCYLIGSGGKGNAPGAKQRCTYACDDGTQVTRYYADCPDEITK